MLQGGREKDLDQFLTKPEIAKYCVDFLSNITNLNNFNYIIEPSCGNGAFVKLLPNNTIYMDIDAVDENIRADFLKSNIPRSDLTYLTIGNPPYGKNSNLAVKFFNHAASYSNMIAFILPKTFVKSSIQNQLDLSFHLFRSLEIPENSFLFMDKDYSVPCVFQIWSRYTILSPPFNQPRLATPKTLTTQDFLFVNVDENPDIIIRRNGVLAGKIFTDNLDKWITDNHYFIKIIDRNKVQQVVDNLKSLDLEHCEIKYATSGYPSISKSELCQMYNQKF